MAFCANPNMKRRCTICERYSGCPYAFWPAYFEDCLGYNKGVEMEDIIKIKLADLELSNESSVYRRKCPVCKDGILLVGREAGTFKLSPHDNCIACGQKFFYTDIDDWNVKEHLPG